MIFSELLDCLRGETINIAIIDNLQFICIAPKNSAALVPYYTRTVAWINIGANVDSSDAFAAHISVTLDV